MILTPGFAETLYNYYSNETDHDQTTISVKQNTTELYENVDGYEIVYLVVNHPNNVDKQEVEQWTAHIRDDHEEITISNYSRTSVYEFTVNNSTRGS